MNKIRTSKFVECGSNAVALLTILLVVTFSSASAKEHKSKASDAASQVVAHISFSGLSTLDMAMQEQVGDKPYLYVQHSRGEGISGVDVSEPAKPIGVHEVQVTSRKYEFSPSSLRVKKGEQVRLIMGFSSAIPST